MTHHKLPPTLETALKDPAYERARPEDVDEALARLGCTPSQSFRSFYEAKAGPFGSEHTGFELLDITDQDTNIETETQACRDVHGFPAHLLVLTRLLGNAVLVYDCKTDVVYDVAFEGSDEKLLAGELAPRWKSFDAFLHAYFVGPWRSGAKP
jgi:hypothetical protein